MLLTIYLYDLEIKESQKQHDEKTSKINSYEIRKKQLETEKANVAKENEELKSMLTRKQHEIEKRKNALLLQRQKDYPDVRIYERLLGLKIDATKPETLRFTFNHVSPSDLTKSCELVLGLTSDDYKVLETVPKLDPITTHELEKELNAKGNLPEFLKLIRTQLVDALQS